MEKQSIKETIEILEGLKVLGVAGVKMAKDGKFGLDDLAHVVALGAQVGTVAEAVQGAELVKEELKDLSKEEVLAIVAKIYEVADALKAAKA